MRELKFRAWDGDDSISHKDGEYIYVKAEWHPYKNKRGYVKRHRLVLEKKLGYYIPKRSIVHHKDKNKRNDHPDNLELTPNQSLHAKSHDVSKRNTNGQFVANDPYFKEIKFRLYNKHTQQYEIYDLSKLIRTTFRNSQFTFAGRFTGLKDKNGKDIYEGDLLKFFDKVIAVVVFQDLGGWSYKWINETYIRVRQRNPEPFFHNITLWEVAGNIYENPNLLK